MILAIITFAVGTIVGLCLSALGGANKSHSRKDLPYYIRALKDANNENKRLESNLEHKDATITSLANESADKDSTIELQKQDIEQLTKQNQDFLKVLRIDSKEKV